MSIANILYVEGETDVALFNALLATRPDHKLNVVSAGGKGGLRGRVRQNDRAVYIRDRDFDYPPPPPAAIDHPTPEEQPSPRRTVGWRWSRHEVESYLLDPSVLEAALGVDAEFIAKEQVAAARRIAPYQAARWTIGQFRSHLPPNFELSTIAQRPNGAKPLKEFHLPAEPEDVPRQRSFAVGQVRTFVERFEADAKPEALSAAFEIHLSRQAALLSAEEVLLWCSGKDLASALTPALSGLRGLGRLSGRELIQHALDWATDEPEQFLERVAEVAAFLDTLVG